MVKHKLTSGHEIYLDGGLMHQLDSLVYNVKSDWDFIIIITGDRMVRTGKSVLAMNVGAYLADRLKTPFTMENIFFDSQKMIDFAQSKKYHVLVYDEGRESLASSKHTLKVQKDILDYFAECGQLNHIFIIVLPDFFELKENIAVARSEFLINVWRSSKDILVDMYKDGTKRPITKFQRGFFELFNRKKKCLLYDLSKSTRRKNYQLVRPNIKGRFTNNYPVDEMEYRKKKKESLARFQEKKKLTDVMAGKYQTIVEKMVVEMTAKGISQRKIAEELGNGISFFTVNQIVKEQNEIAKEKKDKEEQLNEMEGKGVLF